MLPQNVSRHNINIHEQVIVVAAVVLFAIRQKTRTIFFLFFCYGFSGWVIWTIFIGAHFTLLLVAACWSWFCFFALFSFFIRFAVHVPFAPVDANIFDVLPWLLHSCFVAVEHFRRYSSHHIGSTRRERVRYIGTRCCTFQTNKYMRLTDDMRITRKQRAIQMVHARKYLFCVRIADARKRGRRNMNIFDLFRYSGSASASIISYSFCMHCVCALILTARDFCLPQMRGCAFHESYAIFSLASLASRFRHSLREFIYLLFRSCLPWNVVAQAFTLNLLFFYFLFSPTNERVMCFCM